MLDTKSAESGTLSIHPRGFGFLNLDNPTDIQAAFVAPPDLNPFLAGDHVRAVISCTTDGRLTASQLELVQRSRTLLFGEVVSRRGQPFLRVDREVANTDWRLRPCASETVPPVGTFVIARIAGDTAEVERVLDSSSDPAIERVIARHELPSNFAPEALSEAVSSSNVASGRRDLRALPTVTIDAASTRDIDDAVSVLPADADGSLRLLVSIADVASVVRAGSALDLEAQRRATSVYLPDRVLPMLPPALSEDQLSLLPDVERPCLTAELRLSAEGDVQATDVYRSVIRSWARLTYEQAAAFLDRGELLEAHAAVGPMLAWARTASARLSLARARRGGLEFARDEARVGIDTASGRATVLTPAANTSAHMMIERFMVAANEAIARWLDERGVPVPYRVHPQPERAAVERLESTVRNFGFQAGLGRHLSPLALAALDRQLRDTPVAPAVRDALQKALGPARYAVEPAAHFGLAASRYLHFTSPIRRYADLLVHRAINDYLDGHRPSDALPTALQASCAALNQLSWRASKAESQAQRAITARYMAQHLGEEFDGNITGVRPIGLRVQLRASLITGVIPIDALEQGPYQLASNGCELIGKTRSYSMGAPVRVRATNANELLGVVDFEIVK